MTNVQWRVGDDWVMDDWWGEDKKECNECMMKRMMNGWWRGGWMGEEEENEWVMNRWWMGDDKDGYEERMNGWWRGEWMGMKKNEWVMKRGWMGDEDRMNGWWIEWKGDEERMNGWWRENQWVMKRGWMEHEERMNRGWWRDDVEWRWRKDDGRIKGMMMIKIWWRKEFQ